MDGRPIPRTPMPRIMRCRTRYFFFGAAFGAPGTTLDLALWRPANAGAMFFLADSSFCAVEFAPRCGLPGLTFLTAA